MGNENVIKDILLFLENSNRRLDVKTIALRQILGLTASDEGLVLLRDHLTGVLKSLRELMFGTSQTLAADACSALVNIFADKSSAEKFLDADDDCFVVDIWNGVADPQSSIADPCCMALCNLSNARSGCAKLVHILARAGVTLDNVVRIFCSSQHNSKGANLHYLGPFLSNLTQLPVCRDQLLLPADDGKALKRILPFLQHPDSVVRRGGAVGTLRNCCFDASNHDLLLDVSRVDLLPRLLLPLAGPADDDLDEEEVARLPIDLQYLDDDKKVEPDPDVRKMLLEAILQLCATKKGRETMRRYNAYLVLKQLHRTEVDVEVKLAVENVVDILIKKEEEINIDSYHDVDVPPDLIPRLDGMDEEYLSNG